MKIRFWGVRGSLPTPMDTTQFRNKLLRILSKASDHDLSTAESREEFVSQLSLIDGGVIGGNTSCVEVRSPTKLLIFDMGSGIKRLGNHLLDEIGPGEEKDVHIFLSHTHWDHIMGFPFFMPAYRENFNLTIYSPHPDLEERLRSQQDYRFFPVSLDDMAARKTFVKLGEGEKVQLGDLSIENIQLHHPGDSFGYRVEQGENTFIYSTDSEYKDFSDQAIRKYVDFFQDADVVTFDAQYTLDEAMHHKKDWGHSSAIIGIDLCTAANVGTLVLFHHEPENDDSTIQNILEEARHYQTTNYPDSDLKTVIGYEGLELHL